jgi:hypothetical protein
LHHGADQHRGRLRRRRPFVMAASCERNAHGGYGNQRREPCLHGFAPTKDRMGID